MHVAPERGLDLPLLASVTGGEVLSVGSDWSVADSLLPTGTQLSSLSPWLFGLALLLFLAEILWRRRPKVNA